MVMNKKARELNPEVSPGDRITCLHMDGESAVFGVNGTVKAVKQDPFEKDEYIIEVDWDNKSRLSLLTSTDIWVKAE